MTHYEGILVSWNDHVNSAAMGAEIQGDEMLLNVYVPSNTYMNLKEERHFTYSLTDDRELFYKSTLTGHHDDICELGCSDLIEKDGFYYPVKASVTYFCQVEGENRVKKEDEFGATEIFQFKAKILDKKGSGENIDREDPVVDALVYASRYHIGDEEQKIEIREKVLQILEGVEGHVADMVSEYVKEDGT